MNEENHSNFDDQLMAAAAKLSTEAKPERDLWPGIEQAISQPARPTRAVWNSVWAQAAAVVLLVAGSSGVTYLATTEDADPVSPVAEGPALVFAPVSARFGSMYDLGPDYQDARRSLVVKIDAELNRLTPEERAEVENNLKMIRKAIDEINKVLAAEPDNELLQTLLLSTYREELELMMKVDSITNAAMRRGDI